MTMLIVPPAPKCAVRCSSCPAGMAFPSSNAIMSPVLTEQYLLMEENLLHSSSVDGQEMTEDFVIPLILISKGLDSDMCPLSLSTGIRS